MILPDCVNLCEVGPRDGLQTAKRKLTPKEKAFLIEGAADAGFKMIEFGAFTPFKKRMEKLDDSGETFSLIDQKPGVTYRALVATPDDIENAVSYGVRFVKVSLFASERVGGKTIEENLHNIESCCETAHRLGVGIWGSISLPFCAPDEGIIPVENVERIISKYQEGGIGTVSLADAGGLTNPKLLYDRTVCLKDKFPDLDWVLHLHDTWGMGFANMLAGLQAGVVNFDTSFAGLGGCPFIKGARGNIASEQAVFMMEQMGIETGIDLNKTLELARHVSTLDLGPANSAYLGANTPAK